MPNASTTQTSSASETTGQPVPDTYGYAWTTGKRHAYFELQDTGHSNVDFTRVGIWLQGEGEWDGPMEMWVNDILAWEEGTQPVAAPFGDDLDTTGQNWVRASDG